MLIGLIGDVHGELSALQWALQSLSVADMLICVGDIVDGPQDQACIKLLQDSGIIVLQGNHDYWATRDRTSRLSADELDWLAKLPQTYDGKNWSVCHSLIENEGGERYWEDLTSSQATRKAFEVMPHRVIFCGHTHIAAINVLRTGDMEYLSTMRLRETPRLRLSQQARYLINVGQPTYCAVLYDESSEVNEVSFLFRESPAA